MCRDEKAVDGNAVLAGIAVDKKLAQHLATLIGDKPTSHYGDTFIGIQSLKGCLRAMDHLVQAAIQDL